MESKIIFTCSDEQAAKIISALEALPHILDALTQISEQDANKNRPLKREEIQKEFQIKDSSFFNLQRRGIIQPLRMGGSRLTYYDRQDVLSALQKFNPGKYGR